MDPLAFITPGPTEWLLILVIVLVLIVPVLFGAKKSPEPARGLNVTVFEAKNGWRTRRPYGDVG